MVTKKVEYSRKLKEYEKQKHKEEDDLAELGRAEQQSKVNDFLNRESMVKKQNDIYKMKSQKRSEKNVSSISNMANGLDKQLPSFWVPSETPDAKKAPVPKPVRNINCFILHFRCATSDVELCNISQKYCRKWDLKLSTSII